jgi:cell cycle checkpoint control protein RAD9A
VVKTHRLNLLTPTSLMAPGVPDPTNESNLTIGPKSVKDMIDHFPIAKGPKSDPQLIWTFRETDLEVRSLESSNDAKGLPLPLSHVTHHSLGFTGKTQLATELTISAEEFDVYNIYATPITIAFHLREFNVCEPLTPCFTITESSHYNRPQLHMQTR